MINWAHDGQGLSPRVRGNHQRDFAGVDLAGSIPACAGEPSAHIKEEDPIKVYPRVCGGTTNDNNTGNLSRGLSPRVRGTRERELLVLADMGLSPRVRGNRLPAGRHRPGSRSIPRVRGNRLRVGSIPAYPRSIPACAGEPTEHLIHTFLVKVYPRVCGGTWSSGQMKKPRVGLSPRVRGNRFIALRRPHGNRSIPACAGEPPVAAGQGGAQGVYPRVCGGTRRPESGGVQLQGLSPRVRGNRCPHRLIKIRTRSIPACAGEPSFRWNR